MNNAIEKIAQKFAEGYLSANPGSSKERVNIYHRKVNIYKSNDISFINGITASGLRGVAHLSPSTLSANYNQIQTAARQHLPIVISVDSMSANISAFQYLDCFQLVASSAQEHLYMLILAQRIAELSLVPGMVIAGYSQDDQAITLPADELIKKYLGSSDDQIETTTPAQKIVFGPARRRTPKWFSADLPAMIGAEKDSRAAAFEALGSGKYFFEHLPEIILESIQEFNSIFGIDISLIETQGKSSDNLLISYSGVVQEAYTAIDTSKKPQLLAVKQLKPFPEIAVAAQLSKRQLVAVIEAAPFGGSQSGFFQNIERVSPPSTALHAIGISSELKSDLLNNAIEHLKQDNVPKDILVGLAYTKSSSNYPKHEILLQEINKHYPLLSGLTIGNETSSQGQGKSAVQIPTSLRKHSDKGPNYTKLARFYDDTAYFYQNNELSELVADPFASLAVAPGESAGFFSAVNESNTLPVLKPGKCTGCGDCFVHCPHSALPPLVIGIEPLMKAGMDLAMANGNPITKLTPMLKNLAKLTGKAIKDKKITNLTDFLPEAFENLATQMKLEDEARTLVQAEFDLVLKEINALPVAITEQFFTEPNNAEKGSGSIFSLAVNTNTCTGCGICADVCPDQAMGMEDADAELIKGSEQVYELWEKLPNTDPATLLSLEESKYNPFARILLSRDNYLTMSGASPNESDNPYKTLVHLIAATTNAIIKPVIQPQISRIDELINTISESVHASLSKALPKENLDTLAQTLRETGADKTSFHEIVDKIEEHEHGKLIDTKPLKRKTDLVDGLKNLKWVLEEGPTGVGRAKFGFLVAGKESMSWARTYPNNNFGCPVMVHWQGAAPEQLLGLIQGHVRHTIDNIKLLQRAELEAANKYDPLAHDLEIASLDYNKLSLAERALIPPLLLIAERSDLDQAGWQSLSKILSQELPIKVILLDNIAPPNQNPVIDFIQSSAGLISAIALKKAFVFQGSLADQDHLARGLQNGLSNTHPALFNLYAFKKESHNTEDVNGLAFAELATASRTFPSLFFNPDEEHGFLNGVIDLDANRNFKEDWVVESIALPNEESLDYKITWADWAFTQPAWEDEFKKISSDNANTLLSDYLSLSKKDRAKKTPVIVRVSSTGLVYYSVSRTVVKMTETVLANWKTLQELAGLITEFPARLSEEVKKELTKKFEAEAADLKKEYDAELIVKEQEYTMRLKEQIKEKLIALSRMAKN